MGFSFPPAVRHSCGHLQKYCIFILFVPHYCVHVAVDRGRTGLRARNCTLAQSHGAASTEGICAESFSHCTNVRGCKNAPSKRVTLKPLWWRRFIRDVVVQIGLFLYVSSVRRGSSVGDCQVKGLLFRPEEQWSDKTTSDSLFRPEERCSDKLNV